jgi:hypothetical protein
LIKDPLVQNSSTIAAARAAIEYVDKIKNTEINNVALVRLKMLSQNLIDVCNLKRLANIPIAIEEKPINEIEFENRSSYFPGLEFSELPKVVIDYLQQAENLSDEARCLDALRIFVNYCNIVVFSRFSHGLVLRERNIRAIYE